MFTDINKKPNLTKTNKQLSKNETSDECVNRKRKDSLLNSCPNEKRKRTDYSFEEKSSDESAECISYSKKQRKDSARTEEIEASSSKKKKSVECKQSKYDPESNQKLHSVNGNNEKNMEQEGKSARKKGNATSAKVDLPDLMLNKNTREKVIGEPHSSRTKTSAKKQKLDINDTSKPKTNYSENVVSDSIKPTLSETGFLWDVKPEDLSKPEEECIEDNNEVIFIYFYW